MWSAPMRSMMPSACRTASTCGLTRARRSVTPSRFGELVELGQLRRALGVDEVDALEVEHERRRCGARPRRARGRDPRAPRRWRRRGRRRCAGRRSRERLVAGVLVEVAEDLGPGLPAEQRHRRPSSRRRRASRARARPRSPRRRARPTESTPTIAATATQKSNRVTRWRRRSSATSIMPNTTASMITAPSTAFGRSENSGARTSRVASTRPPVTSEASRRPRARGLVQRAGRQAGRDRHALEHARRRRSPSPGRPTPGSTSMR